MRLQLERERLESKCERIARGLGAQTGKPSKPAVETPGFIPKGYSVAWNKGGRSKEDCKFKHEVPKKSSSLEPCSHRSLCNCIGLGHVWRRQFSSFKAFTNSGALSLEHAYFVLRPYEVLQSSNRLGGAPALPSDTRR